MENIELIHRLNRIQGQIEAVKKSIKIDDEKDCVKTLRLIKAANNALKKFGEAYVIMHLANVWLQIPLKKTWKRI